jgi:PEP-CTERM motif
MAKRIAILALMLLIPALSKADSQGELFTYQAGVFNFLGTPYQGLQFDWPTGYEECFTACGTLTQMALPQGCEAWAVNANGQVAGTCQIAGANNWMGFVDTNGSLDLISYQIPDNGNTTNTFFLGINDSGQVLGTYSTVPEPGTLPLLAVGIIALALVYRRGLTVQGLADRLKVPSQV